MTEELFRQDAYRRHCQARILELVADGVVVDQTVFYPQGGGQPGDTGYLTCADGNRIRIHQTVTEQESGRVLHMTESSNALPEVGEQVELEIDWDRRYRLMRMHSCMHMLCALVPAPVTGGSISDGRGRLDFDLPDPLDKEALTRRLNQLIREGHPMRLRWITDAQLRAQPELVRTMSASPPQGTGKVRLVDFEGVDIQPCGGTHVVNSAEIGPVRVAKVEKKGRQNRRVTVVFAEGGGPDLGTE